jgi:hypothetical protein
VLVLLSPHKVKENWEVYKEHLVTASEATEGGAVLTKGGSEKYLQGIYDRLMNPFSQVMHLWIDDDDEYLLLTHIQICEFTERKTLVLFSLTRTKDVDKETVAQRWLDGYPVIAGHARANKCEGIIGYTDLEYFIKIAKEVSEATNQKIITRYQYYVPLN